MLEFDDGPKGLARLIYASRAASPAQGRASAELMRAILLASIQNNRLAAVTGLLVAGEGRFLQLLEGPAGEVEATFARIRRDPRHTDIVVIAQGAADRRLFRDWNLGRHEIGAQDAGLLAEAGLEGFLPETLDAERALRLITALGARHLR